MIISQDEFGRRDRASSSAHVDVAALAAVRRRAATAATRPAGRRRRDDEPTWVELACGDDDPFFILYTGGTTGESKGALHTHRSAVVGMLNQTVAERIVPSDVYMLTGQMYHIPVVLAMNYMRHGCPLVLMNFEAKLALEIIEAEQRLGLPRHHHDAQLDDGRAGLLELRHLAACATSSTAAGRCRRAVVQDALDTFPCTLIQGYGQTEGTTMSLPLPGGPHPRRATAIHPERLRSCGREGFVTSVRVVDDDGPPRAARTARPPGRSSSASDANMVGYLSRPDLTAQTLRDGWMWTGDIATWDDERYVFIVDRAKDMIISGGENIYSVQVEEAINQHPAVLECAVIGVPDDEWGEAVKAFVVLKPGTTRDRAGHHRRRPGRTWRRYQKPRSVEFVAELPKAPTGKILKRELRAPYWAERDRGV